jgi:hypothetical protein
VGIVQTIEAEYLPRLASLARELLNDYPGLLFYVGSTPVGRTTAFEGHSVYLSCLWPDRSGGEADEVALGISVCHITSEPRVSADVCWGDGQMEADFAPEARHSDDWPEATPETLARLGAAFPGLASALVAALRRGAPPEARLPDHRCDPSNHDDVVKIRRSG